MHHVFRNLPTDIAVVDNDDDERIVGVNIVDAVGDFQMEVHKDSLVTICTKPGSS